MRRPFPALLDLGIIKVRKFVIMIVCVYFLRIFVVMIIQIHEIYVKQAFSITFISGERFSEMLPRTHTRSLTIISILLM